MATTGSILQGTFVRLEPLAELHREPLRAACDADSAVFDELYPIPMYGTHLDAWWAKLQADEAAGARAGYAVLRQGEVVGCSLYMLDEPNLRVEIGNTYYRPEARGGVVNPDAKLLMLTHAFTPGGLYAKGANVVQLRVDAINARSRAAVMRLGAHLDGIIRHDRITWTGRVRDTCVFSITREEWPMVRDKLEARLAALAMG
jgi:RimJ/RimL family protein N-acetyltransferase